MQKQSAASFQSMRQFPTVSKAFQAFNLAWATTFVAATFLLPKAMLKQNVFSTPTAQSSTPIRSSLSTGVDIPPLIQ
jgi:hypothetical protein